MAQYALQSMRSLSLFVVRKRRCSRLNTWQCADQVIFHIKPAFRFRFNGKKICLSASKCHVRNVVS